MRAVADVEPGGVCGVLAQIAPPNMSRKLTGLGKSGNLVGMENTAHPEGAMAASAETRLTRKYAHRGDRVTVHTRKTETYEAGSMTGTLIAWGPQVLRLLVNIGGFGRTVEVHTIRIDRVTAA
jgi:hypothetical protein